MSYQIARAIVGQLWLIASCKLSICSLSLILLVACTKPRPSLLEEVIQKGKLTVVTRNSPTTYYESNEGFAGIEYELITDFALYLGVDVEFIVSDNLKEIIDMVKNGQVDVAAAGLTITPEREAQVMFAPAYQQITSKLIFKQGKKWPRNLSQLNGELRILAHSAYSQELLKLKSDYPGLHWSETTEQTSEELLMMVLDETISYTIVDSTELKLNRRYHPELAFAFTVGQSQSLAWALTKTDDHSLFSKTIDFFGSRNAQGKIKQLKEKYYGHVKKFDYVGAKKFRQATEKKLHKYKSLFVEAAADDLDWRLLAALSYQESLWQPKAKSYTGVRGMMMLTLNTAKQLGVKNRLNPAESIHGGARYLRKIKNRVPQKITEPDRTWFALAGYNIGWGHVEDARFLTIKQGGDPNKWSNIKERLPLLQKKRWYKMTKHGYARGHEPVKYVTNIRRYYDVLVWLDEEQQSFAEPTPPRGSQITSRQLTTTKIAEKKK